MDTLNVYSLIREAAIGSPTGVSFFSIKNYSNQKGEVANYLINIGVDYLKTKQKDIKFLTNLKVAKIKGLKSDPKTLEKARLALIKSLERPDKKMSDGQRFAYKGLRTNVKVNHRTGLLYVYGFKVKKDLVIPNPNQKTVNSSKLTIAKNELRELLKSAKFSNFIVKSAKSMTAAGRTIFIEDAENITMKKDTVTCNFRRYNNPEKPEYTCLQVMSPSGAIVTYKKEGNANPSGYLIYSEMMKKIDGKGDEVRELIWQKIDLTKDQMIEFLNLSQNKIQHTDTIKKYLNK